MEPHSNDVDSASSEPDTKRRKLRKGTTSCWDCKKRKVKCTYDAKSDTVCIACRRRGAPCVSQEEEYQEHSQGNREPLFDRMQRVESLLEQLLEVAHKFDRNVITTNSMHGGFEHSTPASDNQSHTLGSPPETHIATNSAFTRVTNDHKKLSEELLKAFPSQHDVNLFCKSNYIVTYYCHHIFTNPSDCQNVLCESDDSSKQEAFDFVNHLAQIPSSTMPPVLIAKRMMILALFLQYFQSQNLHGLPEHPLLVMNRLMDTAVRLVTSNENIVCCIEGVECIILEGVFHSNGGNLRRAWLAYRKAMVTAQLIKIDRPNPPPIQTLESRRVIDPKFMWFRIAYMDSCLSLMLNLPHGGQETNMEHGTPGETPSRKLERAHTLVARRIIDRNRHEPSLRDLDTTRELDRELLNAAKALPEKFWLPPNFNNLQPNTREAFWEMARLCDQTHHYNLVCVPKLLEHDDKHMLTSKRQYSHLLHLPYLLQNDQASDYHVYAAITCVNASREILSRCNSYRSFNTNTATVYCRSSDFLALMAAMTILIAHIDSHKLAEDWRAHQRLSDRAMVEELLSSFEKIGKRTNDSLTHKSAEQLRCLLEFESEALRGMGQSAHTTVRSLEERCGELQLNIPYFGIIKIDREGITKNGPVETAPPLPLPPDFPDSVYAANHFFSATCFGDVHMPQGQAAPSDLNAGCDLQQNHLQYPALVAGAEDWTLQGDAAFFDRMMRGNVDWDPTLQSTV
jgi:hypothetical protein